MGRDFRNKRILVMGAGRTGLALTRFFRRKGASVILSDNRQAEAIAGLPAVEPGLALDLGGHTEGLFSSADLVVVSPGIPLNLPPLEAARAAGVPVTGEIEIAFGEIEAPLAAVTGTNGKSTTTVVMGEIFNAWGKRTFVGGNLGTPFIEAAEGGYDMVLAELSSFQLETADTFRPRYAALLNISEDHLDRYESMEGYVAAKKRIFGRMVASDVAVLNAEDPSVLRAANGIEARKVFFSSARILDEGMGWEDGSIVWRWNGAERRFRASELRLKGEHNVENVMAAMIPPLLEGCPAELAWEAACSFGGLDHRMVRVRELDSVTWYNDSKGTNVGSVVKSLSGLAAPVTLIAGGKDKGGDYAPLARIVGEKVEHLILIGEAAGRMEAELGGVTRALRAKSMEDAVLLARDLTERGGSVLLSPGCSSFDMFRNFGERGDVYTAAVMALEEGGRV